MQIWRYHPTTGELLGSTAADPNPVEEGQWIMPAHSTPIAPPTPQPGFAETFIGSSWSTVADHRGETWWPTAQQYNDKPGVVVDVLGDPGAHGLTKTEPPAAPVVVPPIVVSALQIRLALSQQGLRAEVEAYVATADQATKDSWQFATSFERDSSMIAAAAAALGKAPADVDALFALAKTL
jgi:hypothetical protein